MAHKCLPVIKGGREFYKIMHNAHAQNLMIDHTHFWYLMMEDTKIIYDANDAKAKNNGSFIRNHRNNC